MPAIRVAEAQLKNKQAAYNYIFAWQSPFAGGAPRAYHSLDLWFVFGILLPEVCGSGPAVERLSQNMQDAWIAFARTGNPSCESMGQWPQYDQKRNTMILGEKCHVEEAPYEEERAV